MNYQSISIPQNFSIDNGRLLIPKLALGIKIKLQRSLECIAKTLTISKMPSGKYSASMSCEVDMQPLSCINTGKSVGIDLGLTDFAVLSTKEKIKNPKLLRKSQGKLTKLQRQLDKKQHSRKRGDTTKQSNTYKKSKVKLAAQHEKIASQCKDFLHRLSKGLLTKTKLLTLRH